MILLTMAIFVINVKDSWSCESPPKFITHTQIFIGEYKFDKHLLNTAFLYFSGYFVCFLYYNNNNNNNIQINHTLHHSIIEYNKHDHL